jgi:hypothetical protein
MRFRHIGVLCVLLTGSQTARGQDGPHIKVGKDTIEFLAGDELVTRLHIAPSYAKPIFWPVYAPGKTPLTRAWPMEKNIAGETTDHIHQKSAWWCHGDVIAEGIDLKQKIKGVDGVDFWSEAKGHGRIVVKEVGEVKNGRGSASITLKLEWQTSDGQKIMDETRTIHFYTLGKTRLIVMTSDLSASVTTIVFGDTKEGSFGIRINDQITASKTGKGKLQNAEGKVGEKDCWGQISAWCDYSGPIDGKEVGLAILADPKNPHPTAWHARGYGLMAANPFGRAKSGFPALKGRNDLVTLKKGERLTFRYGLLLHEGDAASGQVAEHYRRFVDLRAKE